MNGADSVIRGGIFDGGRPDLRGLGIRERLDTLFGVIKRPLAPACQVHSAFEELQGLFKARLAVLHSLDDRFEFP